MITAAKADGFHWVAFCTSIHANKAVRSQRDARASIYLFDRESFTGISLVGKVHVSTSLSVKRHFWYAELGDFFDGYKDEKLCVLLFTPEKYNLFIDNTTIQGKLSR